MLDISAVGVKQAYLQEDLYIRHKPEVEEKLDEVRLNFYRRIWVTLPQI